jgi:hypothetical protein
MHRFILIISHIQLFDTLIKLCFAVKQNARKEKIVLRIMPELLNLPWCIYKL